MTAYRRPRTLPDALSDLAHGGVLLAGGTDIYPASIDRPMPAQIIDLSAIPALRGIAVEDDQLRIGAGVTWSELLAADLPRGFDGLHMAAREIGAVQIQNAGTLAGNLCNASPAADGVPPLLTLDAAVVLVSPNGERRLPLTEFLVGPRQTLRRPGEIMTAILVPRAAADASAVFLKLGARRQMVISIVMVAIALRRDAAGRIGRARVAVGAASAVARRLTELEADLVAAPAGRDAASIVADHHVTSLSPIDDGRATAAYRLDAATELLRRALAQADAHA